MILQVPAIIRHLRQSVGLNVMERMRQGHVAVAMMMPIAFAIRGDVDEARRVVGEGGQQPVGERLAVVEQSFKCQSLGNGTVVKEQVHDAARRQRHPVGYGRIDSSTTHVLPFITINGPNPAVPAWGQVWQSRCRVGP